jgi:hypothetical protein
VEPEFKLPEFDPQKLVFPFLEVSPLKQERNRSRMDSNDQDGGGKSTHCGKIFKFRVACGKWLENDRGMENPGGKVEG